MALIDPFEQAMTTLLNRLGHTAQYQPKALGAGFIASPINLRVLINRAESVSDMGFGELVVDTPQIEVRVVDIPQPTIGDRVLVKGHTYEVTREPLIKDTDRLFWTLVVRLL